MLTIFKTEIEVCYHEIEKSICRCTCGRYAGMRRGSPGLRCGRGGTLTSSYVQMNIPYADFYKAAGVDNASEIDAVTSATRNKTRAGNLAAGSYHVNADGTDITVKLRGKESTTTYTGVDGQKCNILLLLAIERFTADRNWGLF